MKNNQFPVWEAGKLLFEMKCATAQREKVDTCYVVASSHEAAIDLIKRRWPSHHIINITILACEKPGLKAPALIMLIVEE